MGLHNLNPLRNKNQKLANNICPVCQTSGIIPVINGTRDSFDYVCNQCRPEFLISISGSALNSDFLEMLDGDPYARIELQSDIRQYDGKDYPLLLDTLSYFLRIKSAYEYKNFTSSDWASGLLGSNLSLYKIAKSDLDVIYASQETIFNELVKKTYKDLIDNFESRLQKSIRKDELIKYEFSSLKLLLHGEINMTDEIVDLGTWKLPMNQIIKIKQYYREAVNGKLDLSTIVGSDQKKLVGSSRIENSYRVKAIAYEKYLKHIESLIETQTKKNTYIKDQPSRLDFLKIIYDVCKGNTSTSCTIEDIGKEFNLVGEQSRDIAQTLSDFGFIEILTKEGHIRLTPAGISEIEKQSNSQTSTSKGFSKDELKEINKKIDSIIEYLEKLDLGHEVIFEEIESLRTDAQKLSKNDFKKIALGKLFNLGVDGLLNQDIVSEILRNLIGNDLSKYLK